jgi:hypothetical protein
MHGENAERRGHHREWWGKRPLAGHPVSTRNKFWKRLLHKIERKLGKKEINERLKDEK